MTSYHPTRQEARIMASSSAHHQHDFAETYSLLEELAAAGADYGISRPARLLLSEAFVALTDTGRHTPSTTGPLHSITDAAAGFDALDELLVRMLGEADDLELVLRLTRVRDLVAQARAG